MDFNSRAGSAALLRRYCVDIEGKAINYIENFLEPGRYLAQRLDWRGHPLESAILSVREIQAMKLFTNLREARSYASRQAQRAALVVSEKNANGR